MKTYFTFGSVHTHTIDGVVFDHQCVCEIEAESHQAARDKMFEVFGRKWAFQYDTLEHVGMHFYPRGVIALQVGGT